MKAYITRDSAGSVYAGGLERLRIWFNEFNGPKFLKVLLTDKDRYGNPFADITEREGCYAKFGWHMLDNKTGVNSMSVGNWLGYSEDNNANKEVTEYIWNELNKHFKNRPMHEWMEMERNKEVFQEDFLLEINVALKFI